MSNVPKGSTVKDILDGLPETEEVLMGHSIYRGSGILGFINFTCKARDGADLVIQLIVTIGTPVESVINHHSCEWKQHNETQKKLKISNSCSDEHNNLRQGDIIFPTPHFPV